MNPIYFIDVCLNSLMRIRLWRDYNMSKQLRNLLLKLEPYIDYFLAVGLAFIVIGAILIFFSCRFGFYRYWSDFNIWK
jgi:hypothetical protein